PVDANYLFKEPPPTTAQSDSGPILIPDCRPGVNELCPEEGQYVIQFVSKYLGAGFKEKLGQDIADDLDTFIENELKDTGAFENLSDAQHAAIANILRAPQLSFSAQTKQRREGADEYMGEAIFDYGVANRVNLTLNGSFKYF